jgi:hypothetical protein
MKHEASQLEGASVPDQALAVPVEPVARLDPAGFDPSRNWPLEARHQRLPKWVRLELAEGLCAKINDEMAPDIRGVAKRVLGGNCTFSDDDLSLLAGLAELAVDAGLHEGKITNRATLMNIEEARQARAARSVSPEDLA